MGVRDQKPSLVTEGVAKRFTSIQPSIPSLIQLTLSTFSILAGNSARSWELVLCLPLQALKIYLQKCSFILGIILKPVILGLNANL